MIWTDFEGIRLGGEQMPLSGGANESDVAPGTPLAEPLFDAVSDSGTFTADTTWTHTPVGVPRGVVLYVGQSGASNDEIGGATYGGVAMTRVRFAADTTGETSGSYAYVLTSGVPAGAQTVAVAAPIITASKRAYCYTVTAGADTQVEASALQSNDATNPSVNLVTGASARTFITALLASGVNPPSSVTDPAGFTRDKSLSIAVMSFILVRKTVNGTGGTIAVTFTAALDDVALTAVALSTVGG